METVSTCLDEAAGFSIRHVGCASKLSIAGGVSWEEVISPLGKISNGWVVVYLFYVFLPRFRGFFFLLFMANAGGTPAEVQSPQEVGSSIPIKCVGDLVANRIAPTSF